VLSLPFRVLGKIFFKFLDDFMREIYKQIQTVLINKWSNSPTLWVGMNHKRRAAKIPSIPLLGGVLGWVIKKKTIFTALPSY
jgi:hypothetical protein